jgi:hypothetical protein
LQVLILKKMEAREVNEVKEEWQIESEGEF